MAEFADACCAGETRPNAEGAYEFDIDGDRVSFSVTPDSRLMLTKTEIGDLPDVGREHLLRTILESSAASADTVSLEPGGDRLFLQRTGRLDGLDFGQFKADLVSFLSAAQSWRGLLAGYADVSEAIAAESKREENSDAEWVRM